VAIQAISATICNPASTDVVTNVTSALTVVTVGGNTVTFPNFPGQTLLYMSVGTTGGTVQCTVGATIFGQAYAPLTAITLTASNAYVMGPFHSALETPGQSNVISVIFSAAIIVSVAVLQLAGVY
jgi:hypothetical protein